MKKISLFFVFALMFVMTSCDKLDEPFKKEVNIEATGRVVLLEDYTGVRCVNCPAAAEIAHELQETFGESLVVMGVHAGFYSNPYGNYPDFRTEAGKEWYEDYFGFQSNPIGTINRVKGDAGYGFNDGEWPTKVAEELAKEQVAELDIVCNYNEQTRNLNVEVNTVFLQSQSGKYFVTVVWWRTALSGVSYVRNLLVSIQITSIVMCSEVLSMGHGVQRYLTAQCRQMKRFPQHAVLP